MLIFQDKLLRKALQIQSHILHFQRWLHFEFWH